MTTQAPDNVDEIESAKDITLMVSKGAGSTGSADMQEIPISRLDTTKDISIEEVSEASVKTTGYSVTSISFSGTMMFKGSRRTKTTKSGERVRLDELLYDENGVPQPVSISITHDSIGDDESGQTETYTTVLVTSESYEVRSEEVTETAYDWVAMDRS